MDYPYWQKQELHQPLFPDLVWSKPEQKQLAGKLGIVGGNKLGFAAASNSFQQAIDYGIGEARLLLPDSLKSVMPRNIPDILFAPSNSAGSFSGEASSELKALGDFADATLLIGDSGKNSQTALLFGSFIANYEKPTIITRDAVDLLMQEMPDILQKDNVVLITSLAQLQKIFRSTYYPKMITFSIQLTNLVEILHKFTITYPVSIVTFHAEKVVVATAGEVITADIANPMSLWSGQYAVRASCQIIWSPQKRLAALATAVTD